MMVGLSFISHAKIVFLLDLRKSERDFFSYCTCCKNKAMRNDIGDGTRAFRYTTLDIFSFFIISECPAKAEVEDGGVAIQSVLFFFCYKWVQR